MRWSIQLGAGERFQIAFAAALAGGKAGARALATRLAHRPHEALEHARAWWEAEIRALHTPGSDRAPGWLPELETSNPSIARIYATGALGTLYFRRPSPLHGRSYDTLMPRFWQTVTFIWDYSLSSVWHALVDPDVMRAHLEHWMTTDVHTCFGTERLHGLPVGGWYAVNDYAMVRMIWDYVRWTGDRAWLARTVGGRTAGDHLRSYATNHERFRTASGLADYGGINNLLECVSTYVHEVAALNASNVWGLRTAAALLDEPDLARSGDALVKDVLALYADGLGFWHARHPDGLVPVRHCYDLITTLDTIADDLGPERIAEMLTFFERELRTPAWMHALSASDPDAAYSTRPDHQWTGAYTAWPALTLGALWRHGREKDAASWAEGLARSANQGPYGQAHFVEAVAPPFDGGARKSPPDFPYICDWAASSNGAYAAVVIESLFGVRATPEGITATPRLDVADPDARLIGLRYQGRVYDVDRDGVHER